MKLSAVLLSCLALAALPATASAASLGADRSCYGPSEPVQLSGGGFTPNGKVAITVGGQQLGVATANSVGELAVDLTAPEIDGKQRTDTFVATDQTDLAIAATVGVRLTSLDVSVSPKQGNPGKPRRIKARGFTTGKTLYAHFKLGKARRNVKIGRLKGACHTLSVKKQLFSSNAKTGLYSVQFDTRRKFNPRTAPQVTFLVNVFRTFKLSSARTASVAERWAPLP